MNKQQSKHLISCILVFVAVTSVADVAHADVIARHKLAQWGDPLTPPKTRTKCAKWAKGDLPFGGKWKTCVGWKTETKTMQVSLFLEAKAPKLEETMAKELQKQLKKAVNGCAKSAAGAGTTAFLATPGEFGLRAAAAGVAAEETFLGCLATIPDRISGGYAKRFKLKMSQTGKWSKWR